MKPLLIIIDDDAKLNELLTTFLADFGYRIMSATRPAAGLRLIEDNAPALVILDIMLPAMDGFEVCRRIRKMDPALPLIMLTARGDVKDRIVGLELGADDYLAKPFEPRELVARIQTVLRRTRQEGPEKPRKTRTFGALKIDLLKRGVTLEGKAVDLTTNEFEALALLSENPGEVYDRDRILQRLRGIDADAYNRAVDITMSRLRSKLGDDPRHPAYIKTVWGAGYAFVGEEGSHEG